MKMKALVINFDGIGNGLMTYPLLAALERHHGFDLVLQDNALWRDPEMVALMPFQDPPALVPPLWRRFMPSDWDAIKAFIARAEITHVINLRNEGPERDRHYIAFKGSHGMSNLTFWDLHSLPVAPRISHYDAMVALFAHHGIELSHVPRQWLTVLRSPPPSPRRVGLFLGASQEVKRLPANKWAAMAEALMDRGVPIVLFAGMSVDENQLTRGLYADLVGRWGKDLVTLYHDRSLATVIREIGQLDLLISPDTMAVHAAFALGLPTIGLYASTDGEVWRGGPDTVMVQSSVGLDCPQFKPDAGNCNLFDYGCPAPCAEALDHHTAVHLAFGLLRRQAQDAMTERKETLVCVN